MKTHSSTFSRCLVAFITSLLFFLVQSAHAALAQWTGGASLDNKWSNFQNWAGNAKPVAGDDLQFQDGMSHPNNNNDLTSGTTFNSITLFHGASGNSHGYDIAGNSIALNAGIIFYNNSGNPWDNAFRNAITLNSNQTFTAGSLTSSSMGAIDLNSHNLIFDTASNASFAIQGVISGATGIFKTNSGTLTLWSNNTYTGSTTLNGGLLQIFGAQPASPIILGFGTLNASSSVGTITSVGSNGPGSIILSPGPNAGSMTCSNLTLNPSTTFMADLMGNTPGTGYDQVNVNGSVALNNATLSLSLGYTPALGDSFVIINNDGSDPVIGTFAGLPSGSLLTNTGNIFRISYNGGDGNDVTLTTTLGAPPATISSITRLPNQFEQLTGQGLSNLTYTIQAATNLNPVIQWANIGAPLANSNGVFSFTDTNAPLFPIRFYRAVSP